MPKEYNNLGQIEKVDLREIWPNEALDFTRWLAESENLTILGDAVDMELELIETESPVGAFSVDILARESSTGRKVIIENQLEETNHDHLGKIITYAAGKEAEVLIWIVAHARDEHIQAIDWLNQHSDSDVGFFLLEIELWSIEGSHPAPRFNIVEAPNEWAKTVKLSAELNKTEQLKLDYWTKYYEIAKRTPDFMQIFNPHKPMKYHHTELRCGTQNYHIALLIDTELGRIGIEFYVPNNKEIGAKAAEHKELFEERLGLSATVIDATKASGLRFYKDGCDIKESQDKWPDYIAEQLNWALAMRALIDELDL